MIRMLSMLLLLVAAGAHCAAINTTGSLTESTAGRPHRAVVTATAPAEPEPDREPGVVDLPRMPSLSPDGSRIVFTWRGDLWKVPVTGGHAERLTRHPGNDLRSAWSPDGQRIAFGSNRTGTTNVFIMNADGTDVRQITNSDRSSSLAAFGVDDAGNEVVTLTAYREGDTYRAPRPYLCSVYGGDIIRVHDAFGSYPVVSPDGSKVAFTRGASPWSRRHYRGPDNRDVWLFDRSDGSFTRLTTWEGNDGLSQWMDSNTILFLSDRELHCVNVYRMDIRQGEKSIQRLTGFEEDDVKSLAVAADGSTAAFAVWDTLYTLDLRDPNARPEPLKITANQDEADNYQILAIDRKVTEATLSPDDKVMAFIAYGDVYVRNVEDKSPTRRVTHSHAREKDIAWSPDGLKLYFVSDRDGTDSIYAATVTMTRDEIKEDFEKATKPEEEKEEEAGEKPTTQPATQPTTQPVTTQPTTTQPATTQPASTGTPTPAEAPDPPATTQPTTQPTTRPTTQPAEADKNGAGKRAKGKKKKDEEEELPKELKPQRWHDAIKFRIDPVVQTEANDRSPVPSPDGESLSFRRDGGDLMILDLEGGQARTLVPGWDSGINWRWSRNSRYIAYDQSDLDFNSDIWIIRADGSKPAVNVTRHPDDDHAPRWSADGKILAFVSERVNDEYDVWAVFLDKDLETKSTKELDEYFKKTVKAAKKRKPLKVKTPKKDDGDDKDAKAEKKDDDENKKGEEGEENDDDTKDKEDNKDDEADEDEEDELDLDDAYLRLRRITRLAGHEGNVEMTPAGDRIVFTAANPNRGLYSVKWDGSDQKKLTGSMSVQGMSLKGDKLIVVSGGRAGTISPTGSKVDYVDLSDRIRIDLQEQASQKFLEMARVVGESFYDPTLKGLDWPALTRKYHALARQTRTGNEFNHVAMRLLGELNGSHLGVHSRDPASPNRQSKGELGTVHRRVADGYAVVEVVRDSPADRGPMALQPGDIITAIDLEPFGSADTIESRLTDRVGKETIVTVRRTLDDGEAQELTVLITPISSRGLNQLKYRAWQRRNAELVDEWSGGRLGYIHIESMGQASLDEFERDLYAAAVGSDGLVIDVRNNGGGWTADRLLASIMVQPHAYTLPRGADRDAIGHYPQDRLFIQRYTLPMNLLCNEKSFSNAEIVSHAFKTLKRGTLVGQQTYGGVISTGGTTLIDGTLVRLPFRGWYVIGGVDMENNGAIPDIVVPQTPEAESAGSDEQLRAAVEDLLKRLP